MNKPPKFLLIIVLILFAIVSSLVATGLYFFYMIPKKAGVEEERYTLENVYITDSSGGKICFYYDNQYYEYAGSIDNGYSGIANVDIEGNDIQKIYLKQDTVDGTLLSYSEDHIELANHVSYTLSAELPVYLEEDAGITEQNLSDLIIGNTAVTCVFDHGEVCALISNGAVESPTIRVLLKNAGSPYYDSLYITCDGKWSVDGTGQKTNDWISAKELFSGDADSEISVESEDGGFLYLCDSNGKISSEGYEGSFHIRNTEKGYVLINELPMEEYVRYVLPSEMPASFSMEALKAQAVCARTFAYLQMNNNTYASLGANLDDSTSFQVYNSVGTDERCDAAVAETAGQVLTFAGDLVTCYYYSTSAGYTENLEVWENEDSPEYLSVKSCLTGEESYTDLSGEEAFSAFIGTSPASYDSDSPFYRWTAKLNLANITDEDLGTLTKLTVSERSKSGYITALTCTYTYGSVRISNENEIRTFLGKALKELTLADGSTRDFSSVPSACFEVTSVDGFTVILTGGGFGHDVGMSQYGAGKMAENGADYQEILEFYYTGTDITNVSGLES